MRKEPILERFLRNIEISLNGCWDWSGSLGTGGYALLWDGQKLVRAHRFSYSFYYNATIPVDKQIDHLCRNHKCVNPDHLELVTGKENKLRGISFSAINAKVTHCLNGHPYDENNTHYKPNGGRECRTCMREYQRVWRLTHTRKEVNGRRKWMPITL